APGPGGPRAHHTPGDLPGQRSEEFGPADPVPQADGPVRRLVGIGGPPGVLSAVSQQVQPDRAVLVGAGAEVERRAAELLGGGPVVCTTDDVARDASEGGALAGGLCQEGECVGPGNGAVQRAPGALGRATEI